MGHSILARSELIENNNWNFFQRAIS